MSLLDWIFSFSQLILRAFLGLSAVNANGRVADKIQMNLNACILRLELTACHCRLFENLSVILDC